MKSRREFLRTGAGLLATGLALGSARAFAEESPPEGFRSLFDGKTLAGWHALPRAQGVPGGRRGARPTPTISRR